MAQNQIWINNNIKSDIDKYKIVWASYDDITNSSSSFIYLTEPNLTKRIKVRTFL